jgi:hypothetical protein
LLRDNSALSRRDYAFFLARLCLGAPLRNLQQLHWAQIKQDEGGCGCASEWMDGGLQIVNDLLLYRSFRGLKPPEEKS